MNRFEPQDNKFPFNTGIPHNTGLVSYWHNVAPVTKKTPLFVAFGHVYQRTTPKSTTATCIARFRNDTEALDTLNEAKCKFLYRTTRPDQLSVSPKYKYAFASYGTLKRNAAYPLEEQHGVFAMEDKILNAQIWTHPTNIIWPGITTGLNKVDADVYLMTEEGMDYIQSGEEANGYRTRVVQLESGLEAVTFWYEEKNLVERLWNKQDKYPVAIKFAIPT